MREHIFVFFFGWHTRANYYIWSRQLNTGRLLLTRYNTEPCSNVLQMTVCESPKYTLALYVKMSRLCSVNDTMTIKTHSTWCVEFLLKIYPEVYRVIPTRVISIRYYCVYILCVWRLAFFILQLVTHDITPCNLDRYHVLNCAKIHWSALSFRRNLCQFWSSTV